MADFAPINTQAEFDAAIANRLSRENEKFKKQQEAFAAEYDGKIAQLTQSLEEAAKKAKSHEDTVAGLQAQIKSYETRSVKTRIAHEVGIPFELADRLSGDDEDSIRRDAEAMKPFLAGKGAAPLASTEPAAQKGAGVRNDALMELAQRLGKHGG